MKKIKKIKLSEVKDSFVVRISLKRDHVDYLRNLVETGIELDPLLVSEEDNELIDGRHRKQAYTELGITEVRCELKKFNSTSDKIIAALRANVGGSLPPTPADINHTMEILLASGESRKSIIEKMSETVGFPKKLIQNHLDNVQSHMAKARLIKAVNAVASNGKTVHEAAAEYGVKLETLQRNLSGKVDTNTTNVKQLKSHLSQQYGSLNKSIAANLSQVIRELKDGVIESEDAEDIMQHVNKLAARFKICHEEWVKRFASHIGIRAEASEATRVQARAPQVSQGKRALDRMGITS
jgi:ParB-like chromosome segregation protein Spo0J